MRPSVGEAAIATSDLPFSELWTAACQMDRSAWETLWRYCRAPLMLFCMSRYGVSGEDSAQGAFVRLIEQLSRPKPPPKFNTLESLLSYLYECARTEFRERELGWLSRQKVNLNKRDAQDSSDGEHRAVEELLDGTRELLESIPEGDLHKLAPGSSSADAETFWSQLDELVNGTKSNKAWSARLEQSINAIANDNYREALRLRIVEGKGYDEIADLLKISRTNARVRVHRGIGELKGNITGARSAEATEDKSRKEV